MPAHACSVITAGAATDGQKATVSANALTFQVRCSVALRMCWPRKCSWMYGNALAKAGGVVT